MVILKNNNEYYVYEWIRLDTNEPFYVGKGKKDRWKSTNCRNNYFMNIVNKYDVCVNILHDELDEETAFGLESWYINFYKIEMGYNLTNINWGGEGNTLMGESNPNYGNNPYYNKSEQELLEISNKKKSWWKNLKEEDKLLNKQRKSISHMGDKHWNYGKQWSDETKLKISNGRKMAYENGGLRNYKKIICINTKEVFNSLKDASNKYNISVSSISSVLTKNQPYCGYSENGEWLVWMYYEEYVQRTNLGEIIDIDESIKKKLTPVDIEYRRNRFTELRKLGMSYSDISKIISDELGKKISVSMLESDYRVINQNYTTKK